MDKLQIATGTSRRAKSWRNTKITWAELCEKLSKPTRTPETYAEYMKAPKAEQDRIKDVGGFVGGYLRGGQRKADTIGYRTVLTLDLDFAPLDFWMDFSLSFDCAACVHSTHKHSPENPRYRLVIPLDRETAPDEYAAAARKVAEMLDINWFDDTTYEPNRLMYWPSCSIDADYVFAEQDGPAMSVDWLLGMYADWTDISLWPVSSRQMEVRRTAATRQEDPETKKGIVGAFCRAWPVEDVLAELLADVYNPAENDRYTYTQGTTAAGAVVYDGKFLFSHHGSDPAGGVLCNAFDLVRLHKFGHLDKTDARASGNNAASYKKMAAFAAKDARTKKQIAEEAASSARYDFADDCEEAEAPETVEETDAPNPDWAQDLDVDTKGAYQNTAFNYTTILANDPRLRRLFALNEFDRKEYIMRSAPWRAVERKQPVRNVDKSGIRNYIETVYGISSAAKVQDSFLLEAEKNTFHPIREYLEGLTWDGKPRVQTLLIDYFGAKDNAYTREASVKTLVGAVARVFEPGVKFDLVLTLVGKQGAKKSMFFDILGGDWFSDTLTTVQGKEALEQTQGAWIIEIAELAGFKKSEVENIKHFITKRVDTFRPAFKEVAESFPRQCVFVATTNESEFLQDATGNRRFMPVDIEPAMASKDVSEDLREERTQIWAEAYEMYAAGEPLYLSKEAEKLADGEREAHREKDEREGVIIDYLETPLPANWETLPPFDREEWLAAPGEGEARNFVCVAEIWAECLKKPLSEMDRYKTRPINKVMKALEGWRYVNSTKDFPLYGRQKYFVRVREEGAA